MNLEEIFEAYYSCRKHKRSSREALRFEVNLESNLIKLYNDIITGNYFVGPSTAFIVEKPVKSEIFLLGVLETG